MSEQERVYHTPPEVLVDAVLGNPPLGGITDTPDTPDEAKPTGGGWQSMHEPSRSRHASHAHDARCVRGGHLRVAHGVSHHHETPRRSDGEQVAARASGGIRKGGVI